MKLAFRTEAEADLRWFALYYASRLPEGRRQAEQRLRASINLVLENPLAGKPMDGVKSRRLAIVRTPFVLVYIQMGDTIDILRVWDGRSDPRDMIPL